MKNFKILSIIIVLALFLSLMVSCNKNGNETTTETQTEAQTEATTSENTTSSDTSSSAIEGSSATESANTTVAEESSAKDEDTSAPETEASSESSSEAVSEEKTSASTTAKEETTNADTSAKVEESSDEETTTKAEASSVEESSAVEETSNNTTGVEESSAVEESSNADETESEASPSESETATEPETTTEPETETETETETQPEVTTELEVTMTFNGSSCDISNTDAVKVSGKNYTVVKAGTYIISGTMNDGQIRVDVTDTEKVTLLLNNFTGSNSTSAVIYVINADEVYIDMEKNSVNTLTDANSYVFENPADDKPNACIYGSDDITIKGGGTLNVIGNYNNGIGCKNDIDIKNGVVNVTAVKNAVKGNDSVTVRGDAEVNILGAKDAIKSDTTDKADKGFIHIIEEAKVTVVSCSDDALQATQNITITAGATVTIQNAKTDVNCDGTINIADGCIIK